MPVWNITVYFLKIMFKFVQILEKDHLMDWQVWFWKFWEVFLTMSKERYDTYTSGRPKRPINIKY